LRTAFRAAEFGLEAIRRSPERNPMATAVTAISSWSRRRDAIRRYSTSIASQGALSAFSFLLSLLMLRVMDVEDFGVFSLVIVVANLFTGVTNALAATPLTVYAPALDSRRERTRMEATLSAANGALCLGLTAVTAVGGYLYRAEIGFALVCAAFVATFCLRHYWRVFAFARRRPEVALSTDLLYVATGVAALGATTVATKGSFGVDLAFAVLSAVNVASMAGIGRSLAIGIRLPLRRFMPATYRRVWDECGWSLLGVVTTAVQTQAHSFVVSAFAGPAAYAPLAAGNALFGPMRMTVVAWQMVARPDFAAAIARNDEARVWRSIKVSTALFLAGNAIFIVCLYGLWDLVESQLFRQKYAGQPMFLIVALWGAIATVTAVRGILSGAMQAYRTFRPLAMSTVYGGALSLAIAVALFFAFDPAASLIGVLVGEVFTLAYLMRLNRRRSAGP
jgi:O-antigen/teichoic acid export membrane protein